MLKHDRNDGHIPVTLSLASDIEIAAAAAVIMKTSQGRPHTRMSRCVRIMISDIPPMRSLKAALKTEGT